MNSIITSFSSVTIPNKVFVCAMIWGHLFGPNYSSAQKSLPIQTSTANTVLSAEYVLELALSSPVFLNE